jgi:VCBS repeat-containing protein
MSIHAEDGLQYTWEDTASGTSGMAPRTQYSAMLPPLKTKDAIVVAPGEGRYAVYDGNGYMTNPSDPDDYGVGDTVGGMLRFLSFGPANQVPVAVNDTATTPEDTPIDIDVLANDSDPDGDPLTIIAVTDGSIGTVTISNASCCVTYTPNPDANGLDQFTYTITDGNGVTSTATATVDVTVTAVNDAPVAQDDAYTTDEDVALTVPAPGVLGNDSDVEGDALTAVLQTGPTSGALTLNQDGSFDYTPNADFNGSDSFTYVANDGALNSNPATVSITVNPVNDAPVITSTPVEEASVNAEYQYQVTAMDAEGDAITFALDAGPAGMAMDAAGLVTWTPTLFDLGDHTVTVSASDGSLTGTQSYTLTVIPAGAGTDGPVFFSNVSNLVGPPGVATPYNNANIYAYDGAAYSAVLYFIDTMGFQANIDGLQMVDADTFYVSFANTELTTVPGIAAVQDEDVLFYDAGTWSLYFDGTAQGLTTNGHDIDAISVVDGTLYFSTVGNSDVGGLGSADDGDIYSWDGSSFSRVFDASVVGLPGVADIDGLTVKGTTFYMSFNRDAGTSVPGIGTVEDEAVVSYDGSTWSLYFSGPGLDADDGQDIDAVHVP